MAIFSFKTDGKSEAFCNEIAQEMIRLFGIAESEAVLRISKAWAHIPQIVGQDVIYHETADYWASTIYYGNDSFWWIADRASKNLPPLKPLSLD